MSLSRYMPLFSPRGKSLQSKLCISRASETKHFIRIHEIISSFCSKSRKAWKAFASYNFKIRHDRTYMRYVLHTHSHTNTCAQMELYLYRDTHKKKNGNHFIRLALLKSVCKGNTHSLCIFHIDLFQNQFPMQKKTHTLASYRSDGYKRHWKCYGDEQTGEKNESKNCFRSKGK